MVAQPERTITAQAVKTNAMAFINLYGKVEAVKGRNNRVKAPKKSSKCLELLHRFYSV